MLQVEQVDNVLQPLGNTGEELFKENSTFIFTIKAPIYWWVDCDWVKYKFNMPLSDFEFCFDTFESTQQQELIQAHEYISNLDPYQLMQILPLATYITGVIELSYREIVEVCENYIAGEYIYHKQYSFPNEREWTDFCETLLDIKGVRDLMEDE